ncbi:MAG: hypothetical protein AVDCRST_MAG22-3227, partial [uncultured Rubrobacteraceae bacterium]
MVRHPLAHASALRYCPTMLGGTEEAARLMEAGERDGAERAL